MSHINPITAEEVALIAAAVEEKVVPRIIAALEPRFEAIERRFEALEKKVDDLAEILEAHITGTNERLERIERHLSLEPAR